MARTCWDDLTVRLGGSKSEGRNYDNLPLGDNIITRYILPVGGFFMNFVNKCFK